MKYIKKITTSIAFLCFTVTAFSQNANPNGVIAMRKVAAVNAPVPTTETSIQVALLLDTSNSMDGLIEQAKSRLWNIVNTLTTLRYDGAEPNIQISLYEYGNDGLDSRGNYIRQVIPLSSDLDLLSEKLFALRTNGGSEFCGAVIHDAVKNLKWEDGDSHMKLIYIAGNEPFNQGPINYKESIAQAKNNTIYINTIHCGDRLTGINELWKDGADRGNGKYFHIDSDKEVIYVATPYDDRIESLNAQLNDTYIGYGSLGYEKKQAQYEQDANANSISKENNINRTISKTKMNAYDNRHWDVVDRYNEDADYIMNLKDEELPDELKNKTTKEKEAIITELDSKRKNIQHEIGSLSKKREEYIQDELAKRGESEIDDLGKAIEKSIMEIADDSGFEY